MTAIKPKYKTKSYYKKYVTQKRLENKTSKIKHKTLGPKGFISYLGEKAILYSRAKPGAIALDYLLYYSFIASFGRRPKGISMVRF